MPFTDDSKIITSAADCQVRLSLLLENGSVETKRLSKHQGRVHSLAVEPGSPYVFYSCGEDGYVQHYDLRSCSATKLFYCSSFAENSRSSSVGLNSIVIDPRNPNYFAVGGADVYARVYDIRKYQVSPSSKEGSPANSFCPQHLIGKDDVRITAVAYSNTSELLVSYNDELIYLFQRNMGFGPNVVPSPSVSKFLFWSCLIIHFDSLKLMNATVLQDQKVSWHATPFEERLEKALSEDNFISQRFQRGSPWLC